MKAVFSIGYLMTEQAANNKPATYECVDADPEYIPGEHADNDGGAFYFVNIDCGNSGLCPPYQANKATTCVVCSK